MFLFRWRLALLASCSIFFSECMKHLYTSETLAVKRNAPRGVVPVPASIHPSPPQVAVSIGFWFFLPASSLRKT